MIRRLEGARFGVGAEWIAFSPDGRQIAGGNAEGMVRFWDRGSGRLLGTRYVLEVSSPGIERPVRWHRHWVRFVGRDVNVKLAGLGRVRARIVAVPSEDIVVLQPQGGAEREYRLAEARDARLASDEDR